MRHIFIINPVSGKGNALQLEPSLRAALERSGADWEIHRSEAPGEATAYVRQKAAEGPARFYACGGDGTLHEVIEGIKDFPDSAVGVIPAGTGNDFVKSFGDREVFLDPVRQLNGTVHKIDLIRAGDHFSVNVINIGFDCEVVAWVDAHRNNPLCRGPLAYLLGVLNVLFRKLGTELEFSFNGKNIKGRYLLCTAANGQFYGGGFRPAPKAALDDGLMDFAIVKKVSRLRFLSLLPSYRTGSYIDRKDVRDILTVDRCSELVITAHEGSNVCIDGEIYPFRELKLEMLPGTVNFIIPEGLQGPAPDPA
ncbi:MAG: diacylglycerol kinase family lipid kinase [Oscillospiraceae bacterium]|nr:diacylglycerol kinase family lipid kinase [Oscillospiraceae bacterium]